MSREQWLEIGVAPSPTWLRAVTAGWRRVFSEQHRTVAVPEVAQYVTDQRLCAVGHLPSVLAVAVDLAGMVLYGVLASGERLPWAPRGATLARNKISREGDRRLPEE